MEQKPAERLVSSASALAAQATKRRKQRDNDERRVLDPSGALHHHWSMVVSLAFLYNFWSLSYRFAFREIDHESVAFWFTLDYLADLIYGFDVVINFRTGYLEEGVLVSELNKIGSHYRESTQFYLDCFCLLPLDFLYLSIGFNSLLRCCRLAKIYKFWAFVDRSERHSNHPNVFRTFALVHYILVILHWNACIFHLISRPPHQLIELNLLQANHQGKPVATPAECSDTLCQYLHSFYWSTLALTFVGDLPRPRTRAEYLFVTLELIFGLFLFASVLGHVANIVTSVSAARKEFQAKLDAVKTFMRMRRVSEELQNKVIRWFDYLWISQKASDEDKMVACLPDRLKAEIAIQVHLDTLKRVDIFQNTEAGFLCELVLRLKPVLFSPGDYVCRKNEVGHEMYIVSRGILEVVAEEQGSLGAGRRPHVVATLKAGSYFGEISVLNVGLAGNKRTASVRSVGYSDLFCLKRQDLWDVLRNYPNAEARIRARAEERLSKLDRQTATSASVVPTVGGAAAAAVTAPSAPPSTATTMALEPTGREHRRRLYSSGSRHKPDDCCKGRARLAGRSRGSEPSKAGQASGDTAPAWPAHCCEWTGLSSGHEPLIDELRPRARRRRQAAAFPLGSAGSASEESELAVARRRQPRPFNLLAQSSSESVSHLVGEQKQQQTASSLALTREDRQRRRHWSVRCRRCCCKQRMLPCATSTTINSQPADRHRASCYLAAATSAGQSPQQSSDQQPAGLYWIPAQPAPFLQLPLLAAGHLAASSGQLQVLQAPTLHSVASTSHLEPTAGGLADETGLSLRSSSHSRLSSQWSRSQDQVEIQMEPSASHEFDP